MKDGFTKSAIITFASMTAGFFVQKALDKWFPSKNEESISKLNKPSNPEIKDA